MDKVLQPNNILLTDLDAHKWYSKSEFVLVSVWAERVIGGIFFHKQRQDLRDYGLGLFNGECKTCP